MSVWYRNRYWLLGDGADAEAQRWVAEDSHKEICYSSPKAVELVEIGNHLPPALPVPPDGFVIVVISDVDVYGVGPKFGVAHPCGHGGWIEPSDNEEIEERSGRLDDFKHPFPQDTGRDLSKGGP